MLDQVSSVAETRRHMAGVVALGLSGSGLVAVAGSKPWADLPTKSGPIGLNADELLKQPLCGALGLLLLATWGVILVTGPLTRRIAAGFSLVVVAGVVMTVINGWSIASRAAEQLGGGTPTRNNWIWAALIGAVVVGAASGLALRLAPTWPTMSARYDSPVSAGPTLQTSEVVGSEEGGSDTQRELWEQITDGHDPTMRQGPDTRA